MSGWMNCLRKSDTKRHKQILGADKAPFFRFRHHTNDKKEELTDGGFLYKKM